MKKKIFLILILFFICSNLCFSQNKGFVFLDENENGIHEIKEKYIKDVVVTDGFEVVKTDAKGNFEFPDNPGVRFITVTTPSGYKNTTKYYQTIGAKTNTFGLKKTGQQPARFIHITDTHTENLTSWFENLQDYIKSNGVAFIVHTGDFAREYGIDLFATMMTDKTMGTRVVTTIGNHDLVNEGNYGEFYFEKNFGPVYYSFDIGETHFIVTPVMHGDAKASYNGEQVIKWLRKDLDIQPKGKPVVIFNHAYWLNNEACTFSTGTETIDFKQYNLKAFIHGDDHTQLLVKFGNGIRDYCTSTPDKGGRDQSPSCYRVLTFDVGEDKDIRSETRFAEIKNHLVSNAYKQNGAIRIVASAYHALGNVETISLQYGGKRKLMKQNTNFAWETEISDTDDPISVTATFADGNRVSHQTVMDTTLKWINNLGTNVLFAAPVVHDGIVYAATIDDDENEHCGIHAVDAVTGKLLWFFHTKNSIRNNIVVTDDKVLACDVEGILYAVNSKSGELEWKQELHSFFIPLFNNGLGVSNGVVYAGHNSELSAVRISDGKILWRNRALIAGEGSVATYIVQDGRLHATTSFGPRYALDANSGELLWAKKNSGNPYNYAYSTPLFCNDKMYYTEFRSIIEADPATGKVLRETEVPHFLNTPSVPKEKDGVLYVGTGNDGMVAYDIKTLKRLWTFKTQPSLFYTAPYLQFSSAGLSSTVSIIDNKIFFGANDGNIYCIGTTNGEFIWRCNLGSPVLSDACIDKNDMYILDYAGNLFKFDISSVLKINYNPKGAKLIGVNF